ncbi:MAG: hypothetical protein ABSE53_10545 [Terracidiphilus sp.]
MQILAHSNTRGRTSIRPLFPTLAFLVLAIGGATWSRAQGCDNVDSIYQGGKYCIAATTALSGNNPEMPVLTYQGTGNACDTYSVTLDLEFRQPGDSDPNAWTIGIYSSGNLQGNVPWTVDWRQNQGDIGQYAEGGDGEIDYALNGSDYGPDYVDFYVYGQNPSTSSITAALGTLGPPWWYGHALTWESGNQQFLPGWDSTDTFLGPPVWGYPDGFGLSQLDGSPSANPTLVTDNSIWTWTTNLIYGVQVASGHRAAAQAHFQQQMTLMLNNTGGSPQYPNPVSGYCQFTWNGTGNNAYWNADWINLYNGGYWETWTGTGWSYGSATNPNYTPNVCSQPSYTI